MEFYPANRWWSDIIAEEEEQQRIMAPADWKNEVNRMLRAAPQGQIVNVLAQIMKMDMTRLTSAEPAVVYSPKTQEELDLSVWRNMVEEPEKYGDDIFEWLELDEKLNAGPKRWRVSAFWLQKEQELIDAEEELVAPWRALYSQVARQAAVAAERAWVDREVQKFREKCCAAAALRGEAVTVIAAAVRGHQVRTSSPILNCCMCLAHRISPLKTDVGMMCRECAEQGPYEDITGPIVDEWNWFRAEGVDMTVQHKCHDCDEDIHGCDTEWIVNLPFCGGCAEERTKCVGCGGLSSIDDDYMCGVGPFCASRCARNWCKE